MKRVTQAEHRRAIAMLHRLADKAMTRALSSALAPLTARVNARAALTASALDELDTFGSAWTVAVAANLLPLIDETFGLGALGAARQLREAVAARTENAALVPLQVQVNEARKRWLAASEPRWFKLGDEIWAKAKTELLAGITAGEGVDLLAARLESVAELAGPLARAVAHDQAVASANAGSFAEVSALGMTHGPEGKQWLCVASGTRVASAKPVEIVKRRRGVGLAATITTAAGRVLTVTPDHPVLTLNGWVRAASLLPGQQIICDRGGIESLEEKLPSLLEGGLRSDGLNPDVVHAPPVVDEVFDAASILSAERRVMGVVMDLDCYPIECEVEVVPIDGELASVLNLAACEFFSEEILELTDEGLQALLCLGGADQHVLGLDVRSIAPSGVGALASALVAHSGGFSELDGQVACLTPPTDRDSGSDEAVLECRLAHAKLLGNHSKRVPSLVSSNSRVHIDIDPSSLNTEPLGGAGLLSGRGVIGKPMSRGISHAPQDAALTESPTYHRGRESEVGCDVLAGLIGQVATDEIVNIEVRSAPAGHFYDLVTEQGWFVANGIIVHNSTNDARTRETHADAHGQIQRVDRPFDIGGYEGMYPGDPSLPAEEAAGCRCALIYVEAISDVGPSDLEHITMEVPTDTEAIAAAAQPCGCSAAHDCGCHMGLTAAAEVHTGGMVALVPTEADAQRLAVDGYEPADVLHCTLAFLGDGVALPEVTRTEVLSIAQALAADTAPIIGDAHGLALFNAASDEPCSVYLVGDTDLIGPRGTPPLQEVHDRLWAELYDYGVEGFPEQHSPWLPHLAISYHDDLSLLGEAGTPVTFDRLRVAFGQDAVTDFPLSVGDTVAPTGEEAMQTMTDQQAKSIGDGIGAVLLSALNVSTVTDAASTGTTASTVTLAPADTAPPVAPTPPAPTPDAPAQDPAMAVPEEFHILMVTEEQPTQEKPQRYFMAQCFDWREPPFPLMWLNTDTHSEGSPDPSVEVGLITRVERQGLEIHSWGHWDDPVNLDAAEARRRVENGMLQWNSVDIGEVGEADIELVFPPPGTLAPDGIEVMEPEQIRFHHGRLALSTLVFAPAQENAMIEPLIFADGSTEVPAPALAMSADELALVAAAYPMTIPDVPDASWFTKPPLQALRRGALTITDEGRVYGLLAPGAVPHVGKSERVTVPLRNVDYRDFLRGETPVRLADGTVGRVVTGNLTMACGHASPNLPNGATVEHYDNSCSLFATAVCGEAHGDVWIAGALLPGVEPDQVRRAMACQLSGHWNPHELARGRYSLLAGLLVPIPGFPKGRTEATATSRWGPNEDGDLVLVASAVPVVFEQTTGDGPALAPVAERIARSVGLDRRSRASALNDRVKAGR